MKGLLNKIVPSNFTDLVGLTKKLIKSKNPAGRAAMFYSFIGMLLIPIDWVFQYFEKKLYRKSSKPKMPLIFVCGPPRSGTTLVAQVLIKSLPVFYFNNLTSIFPNSPIISNKIFERFSRNRNKSVSFKSLYGRTSKLWSPNDALYLWDRWTGVPRNKIPEGITADNQIKMQHFFGAVEEYSGQPLINKNNKLNTFADEIANVMDTAYFICLDRNPVYLAQSELLASRFIHGDEKIPYGVRFDEVNKTTKNQIFNPIEQVCNQVLLHKKMMFKQQSLIGKKRFIVLPYEDFCDNPAKWVCKISNDILGKKLDEALVGENLSAFQRSESQKVDDDTFARIKSFMESATYNSNYISKTIKKPTKRTETKKYLDGSDLLKQKIGVAGTSNKQKIEID